MITLFDVLFTQGEKFKTDTGALPRSWVKTVTFIFHPQSIFC